MPTERKTLAIERLLRRSTLQNHIKVDELPMPDGQQKVELIKLRGSFTSFGAPGANTNTETGSPPAEKTVKAAATSGHDIVVTIPHATLVELQPTASGWFAVLLIDKAAKGAIESFVNIARKHYKQTTMHSAFVSPFSEPLISENGHTRVHVKISEYSGMMTSTTFYDETGGKIFAPGDQIVDLTEKPKRLLGSCSPTIHMAGYWHDETKQGPLLYLTSVSALSVEARNELLRGVPIISEVQQNQDGTVSRHEFAPSELSFVPPSVQSINKDESHSVSPPAVLQPRDAEPIE